MKAARLHPDAKHLRVEDIPEPRLTSGSAVVRLKNAFVPKVMSRLIDGSGHYHTPQRPFTPGMCAVGEVETVADDVHGLTVGELVYCDNYLEGRYPAAGNETVVNDLVFIGNFGMGLSPDHLLNQWPNGTFAEKMVLPAECIVPIPAKIPVEPRLLCRLGWLGSAYAGLLKANLRAGQTVLVNGASGVMGTGAVLLALAMGASRVYAVGRRKNALEALKALDSRVVPATDLNWDGFVDVAINCVYSEDSKSVESMFTKVRRRGAVVVVSYPKEVTKVPLDWLLTNEIEIKGSMWFERRMVSEILRMVCSGNLNFAAFKAVEFSLERVNDAVATALTLTEPLSHVVIKFD